MQMPDLVLRQRFSATTTDEASEAIRSIFGVGTLTSSGGALRFEQSSLVDDGISVTRLASSGSAVRFSTASAPDLAVVVVREGSALLRRGADEAVLGEGAVGLIPSPEALSLEWERVTLDVFSFPVSSVGRLLGSSGHPIRLHAPQLTPSSASLAAFWRRLGDVVAFQVLSEPDLYGRELVRTQMIDALMAATVEAFSLSDHEEDVSSRDEDVLRRALAFLGAHLGDPIGVTDVARAALVSVRGLQLLFQRRLEQTPVTKLRRLRLEAARAALLDVGVRSTVGGVARRFGYTNFGRFSAHYREEYDESPSTTLQRAVEEAEQ